MVCNIYNIVKLQKINSKFKNISFNMLPLVAPEIFMGLLRYQCTVFIVFIILIHYENKY